MASEHQIPIGPDAFLRPFEEADAEELTAVMAANREHLVPWMQQAKTYERADAEKYVARKRAQEEENNGFGRAIVLDGRIAGAIGFHAVDWVNRSTSIGYWLAADAVGRGLMTAAVRALVDHAFGVWDLHRVVIEVVVDNAPSRAIPERLGFREEALLREAKLLPSGYEDAILYTMLAPEWTSSPTGDATATDDGGA